jgi:hypothetical protein
MPEASWAMVWSCQWMFSFEASDIALRACDMPEQRVARHCIRDCALFHDAGVFIESDSAFVSKADRRPALNMQIPPITPATAPIQGSLKDALARKFL